jgi:hypothetical protein
LIVGVESAERNELASNAGLIQREKAKNFVLIIVTKGEETGIDSSHIVL